MDKIEKAIQRQVGDVHPNGKWSWTEYKPGKFDWRPIKNATASPNPPSANAKGDSDSSSKPIAKPAPAGAKKMSIQQLKEWAPKTKENVLLVVLNNVKGNAATRQVVYDELVARGVDESKMNTAGTLQELWDNQKRRAAIVNAGDDEEEEEGGDTSTASDDEADDESGDGITEDWWMNKKDERIRKMFHGLKTKRDWIRYDNFIDKKKRQQPHYVKPRKVMQMLNRQFLEFLENPEQRFMISSGGAGVGKSFAFEDIAKITNKKPFDPEKHAPGDADYDYIETTDIDGKKKLLELLKAHNGKILLFDDTDAILTRQDLTSIMKKATSMTGKRIVGDPQDPKTNFAFTGRIVVLTNKDMDTLMEEEDSKAIISRASIKSDIRMTKNETVEILRDRFLHMKFPQVPALEDPQENEKERREVFQTILDNLHNISPKSFTTRKFGEMLSAKRLTERANLRAQQSDELASKFGEDEDWRDLAIQILLKGENDEFLSNEPETEIEKEFVKKHPKEAKELFGIGEEEEVKKAVEEEEEMTLEKAEDLLLFGDVDFEKAEDLLLSK